MRKTGRYLVVYLIIVIGMAVLFMRLPTSFLPEEDQGVFMTMIQLGGGNTRAHPESAGSGHPVLSEQ